MADFNTHGGYFAPKGYFKVNEGGSHEENPNGGVQIGMDQQGVPNLLEEGEPVYNDYVYSDNIYADGGILEQNNIPVKYAGKLYSDIVDKIFKEMEVEGNELDNISHNGLDVMLTRLANAQEQQKQMEEQKRQEDELASELSNLSPEELDQLEQMLAQEQSAGTDNPMYGEGPVGAQGEPGIPPEQMMGPAEPMPMMANGGFLRKYDKGGELKKMTELFYNYNKARNYFAENVPDGETFGGLSHDEVNQLFSSVQNQLFTLLSGASKSELKRYVEYLNDANNNSFPDEFRSHLVDAVNSYAKSTKKKKGQNFFTRGMMASVMNDPMTGAVSQSAGWVSSPDEITQSGEAASSEGAQKLRESLAEIATIPLYELGAGALGAGYRSLRGVQTAAEIMEEARGAVKAAEHSAKAAKSAGAIKAAQEAAKAERAVQKAAIEVAENSAKANREAIKQAAMSEAKATTKKAAKKAAKQLEKAADKLVRDEVNLQEARNAARKAGWQQFGNAVKGGASSAWNAITAPHQWAKYPIGTLGPIGAGIGIHSAFGYGADDESAPYVPYVYAPQESAVTERLAGPRQNQETRHDVYEPTYVPKNGAIEDENDYRDLNRDVLPDGTIASDTTAVAVPAAAQPKPSASFGISSVAIPAGYDENSFPFGCGGKMRRFGDGGSKPKVEDMYVLRTDNNGDFVDDIEPATVVAEKPVRRRVGYEIPYSSEPYVRSVEQPRSDITSKMNRLLLAKSFLNDDEDNSYLLPLLMQSYDESNRFDGITNPTGRIDRRRRYPEDYWRDNGYLFNGIRNPQTYIEPAQIDPGIFNIPLAPAPVAPEYQPEFISLEDADAMTSGISPVVEQQYVDPREYYSGLYTEEVPVSRSGEWTREAEARARGRLTPYDVTITQPELVPYDFNIPFDEDAYFNSNSGSVASAASSTPVVEPTKIVKQEKSDTGDSGEKGGEYNNNYLPTWPRYAGAIGSGILGLYDLFQAPDRYDIPQATPYVPDGRIHMQNQAYNPIDQAMLANAIAAQGNATNRALRNSGLGAGTAAALLAADNNTTGNLGTGFIQAWDANNQRRNAVLAANNATEAQRAQFDYGVARDRASIMNAVEKQNLQNLLYQQMMNNEAESAKYTAVGNQINNGLQALSAIGRENFSANQIRSDRSMQDYYIDANGVVRRKPQLSNLGGFLKKLKK